MARVVRLLSALTLASLLAPGCAGQECDFHSQCGEGRYCERGRCLQQCREDFDCDPGQQCNVIGQCVMATDGGSLRPDSGPPPGFDGGPPPRLDSGPPPGVDSGPPSGIDSGPPLGIDSGPPRVDSGPLPGTGRYMDRCASDADCSTGRCVDDVGGTRACTVTCATHRDCASEHACVDGVCRRDDTGTYCSLSRPESCLLGLCFGNTTSGTGQCTRQCDSAVDCPAGYACTDAGGVRVCADIERPCASPTDCATGLCFPGVGCTASCRSASDCPRRFPGSPAYGCGVPTGGSQAVCLPPDDIVGGDGIGASCRYDSSSGIPLSLCRSGGCDDEAPGGPMCTQACTTEGGCGPGFGCFPSVQGGEIWLICSRSGDRPVGESCSTGRDCDSGLCRDPGFCTRLCTDDRLCPTGMRCESVPSTPIAFCVR